MEEKRKNIIQIKKNYCTDLALSEGKINKTDFEKSHKIGDTEKWVEMPYVGQSFVFMQSFLLNLTTEQRLRAMKDMNDLSFEKLREMGGFGGSIHQFFKEANKHSHQDKLKDLPQQRARLAIILDIPLEFLLKNNPSQADISRNEYLEYRLIGEEVEFNDIKKLIERPKHRTIRAININNGKNEFPCLTMETIHLRMDLRKTFFTLEFYIPSQIDINLVLINSLVNSLNNLNIYNIIFSIPLLRNSYKLSIICSYVKEQIGDAKVFSQFLLNRRNGQLLYPYDLDFSKLKYIPF